jgi:hypothetical protein
MNRWRASMLSPRRSLALEAELERLRALQQSREKGPRGARPRHAQARRRPLARQFAPLRGAPRSGPPAPRRRKIGRPARAEPRRRRRKERLRAAREEALEAERRELEILEGQAAAIGEEHAATRAEAGGSRRAPPRRARAMARLEQQFRETSARRDAIAPEIERLGAERSRLLADNIELDRRSAQLAGEIGRPGSARGRHGLRGSRICAKPCARARNRSSSCAPAVEENARTALANRSRAGPQASRAEVSR